MRTLVAATAAAVLLPFLGSPPSASMASPAPPSGCDPFTTPEYAGEVPTAEEVIGFPIGQQEVTVSESDAYLQAVSAASDRVTDGVLATSVEGRPLRYAMVGEPSDVRRAQRAAKVLRNPKTSRARAARVAERAPAIAWIAGNVHGNEESGTDASLRVLHDLADRTDCAATQIRDHTVVVILPTQNPDGREADTRRNAYGFDMNRDWFARTQSETDGKVEALRQYPPVLFIDDHEMGQPSFFFPPNADPVYHEIADRSVTWINDLYGGSNQAEFDRQGIPYFNYNIYDLLYMGYGDTVPTTAFNGAGMTFEKNNRDPISQRVDEQYTALWNTVSTLALNKKSVLKGWAASYRQALREGRRGILEKNDVFAPGNEVQLEVPDIKVRHYFIERPRGSKIAEVKGLVRRLQRMDVEVRRLTRPLRVPDYTPYGRSPRARTLPAGSYWVSMAQGQKHWVQSMMNEDTYVPFPYFYDVTAWSGPLLFNLAGGRSGARLNPRSTTVAPVREPAAPRRPRNAPAVGLWETDDSTTAYESTGWMRWLFDEKWQVPFRAISTPGISEAALAPIDVLVVPNGDAEDTYDALSPSGREALRAWLADGGRFVGMAGGTELAARLQLTTARLSSPTSDVPGSLVRATMPRGPLRRGVGSTVWNFYAYDNLMRLTDSSSVAAKYPAASSPTFFVSGFERGAEELAGSAAVADEAYGKGRVVVFAGEPNFRAFTDGTQKILWNAIYGADPKRTRTRLDLVSPRQLSRARKAAAVDAGALIDLDARLVLTVRPGTAGRAAEVLEDNGLRFTTASQSDGTVRYVARVRTAEESPVTRELAADLAELGEGVLAARIP